MKINTQRGIAPILILLLIVLIAGGGIYAAKAISSKKPKVDQNANMEATSTAATSTPTDVSTSTDKTLQITLNEENNSGQSGQVVITEVDGKAKVIVNITGKPSSVPMPAHIHLGSCPDVGAVKYPLTSLGKGASQTMLDVSIDQLLSELPLSINVHKSAAELGVYVACGDIGTSTPKTSASTTKASVSAKASASTTAGVKTKVKVETSTY